MKKTTISKSTHKLMSVLLAFVMVFSVFAIMPVNNVAHADTYTAGTYKVTMSSGNLNIRSTASTTGSVLGTIPNGTVIQLTSFSNDFGKVTYQGITGWVSMQYVTFQSSSGNNTDTDTTPPASYSVGTYKVSITSGNLNMRSSASGSAGVVASIPNGTKLVITKFSNGFGYTKYNNISGWVSMTYMTFVSSSTSTDTDSSSTTTYNKGTYKVSISSGNLNMRSSASGSASVVATIPNGTQLVITTFSNGFGYTKYNNTSGWVSMTYLTYVSSSTSTDTDSSSTTTYNKGTYKVSISSGNLNMRSSASGSASVVASIPNGTQLVITTFSNGFGYTKYNNISGWVSMAYLTYVSSSTSTDTNSTDSSSTYKTGTYKVTLSTGNLNMRSSASSTATVVASVPNGSLLVVTQFSNGYGYTKYNNVSGWVSMQYLTFQSSSTSTDTNSTDSSSTYKTGTYKVTLSTGNLNMRSSASSSAAIVASVPNGTLLVVTQFSNGYGYAKYNNVSGWVSMQYLTFQSSSTSTDTNSTDTSDTYKTGTYKVTVSTGNLNMRSAASSSATVVASVPNGTLLVVTQFSNGYGYAKYNNVSGWVSMQYLTFQSSSTDGENTNTTGTYTVKTADANGTLNMRSAASSTASVIGSVPNNTVVNVTKVSNGYGYITYNGISGWVSMQYLVLKSSSTDVDNTTGTYTVKTADANGNLNMRSAASSTASVIGSVPNNTVVTVTKVSNGYGYITYNGISGWVSMQYLVFKSSSTDGDNTNTTGSYTVKTADVNGNLNIRSAASSTASVIGSVPNNTVVNVTKISNGYGYITYNGISGWVSMQYLTKNGSTNTDTEVTSASVIYTVKTVDANGTLNIRSDASSTASVIGSVPNGTAFPAAKVTNGYASISYNGINGWVSTTYITKLGNAETGYKSGTYSVKTADANGTLNMRCAPSSNGKVIKSVPNKTLMSVSSFYSGYGYTVYEGQSGWVSMQYMTLVSASTDTDSNSEINTDSNSEINTDSNSEINTDSNSEINTDSNSEINTDSNNEINTDSEVDSDSEGNVNQKGTYGDVDLNGKITMSDVTDFQRLVAGLLSWTTQGKINADVNGDGLTSMLDIVLIQQYMAGLIKVFPAEQNAG